DKWDQLTEAEKFRIVEVLKELVQPDKTHLQEPSEPVASKGRKTAAQKKKEDSTKRNLSLHERLEAEALLKNKVITVSSSENVSKEGPKQKRKYTKNATAYWENKKTKKDVVEILSETSEEEIKKTPNEVKEDEHYVLELPFEANETVMNEIPYVVNNHEFDAEEMV
ncbi:hypothetical protein MKX03_018290, partial [Papaver bracteatum]